MQSVLVPVGTLAGTAGASILAVARVRQKDRGKKYGHAVGPCSGLKSDRRLIYVIDRTKIPT